MPTTATPLHIDLRGKSVEEVVEILNQNNYRIPLIFDATADWRQFSILNRDPEQYQNTTITGIMIKEEDAPGLTVIVYDGSEHTLRPGHDLHLFDGEHNGWGWVRGSYLTK